MANLVPFEFWHHQDDRVRVIKVNEENAKILAQDYFDDFNLEYPNRLYFKRDHLGRVYSKSHPYAAVPDGTWLVREIDGKFYAYTKESFEILFRRTK